MNTRTHWQPKFSLGTLFVVVAVAGASLQLYLNLVRHRNAIAAVRTWRATDIIYDFQIDWAKHRIGMRAKRPKDTWRALFFGEDAAIVQIASSEPDLSDRDLQYLPALDGIRILGLNCPKITDVGLQQLASLNELRKLNLMNNSHISDEGLLHLKSLSKLEELWLDNLVGVTDSGRERLQRALPNCTIRYSYLGEAVQSRTVRKSVSIDGHAR